MNWYKINKFSNSPYGYWIPTSGELIPVGFQQHGSKLVTLGIKKGYDEAFGKRWIRIIIGEGDGMSIEIKSKKPNGDQIYSILRLYNELFADSFQRPIIFIDYFGKQLNTNSYEGLQFALENGLQPRVLFSQNNYLDYFHNGHNKGEYLWFIDKDQIFHKKSTKNNIEHEEWEEFNMLDTIASGRFGFNDGKVLATMVLYGSQLKQIYYRKIAKSILNRELNYPIIKEF